MSLNNYGSFYLGAGQSRRHYWWWGDGNGNHGAQYFSAGPLTPNACFCTTEEAEWLGSDGHYGYVVTIKNEGPLAGLYCLQGGGFN
jgi:hypothetical protein